jgi:hypothetical protein
MMMKRILGILLWLVALVLFIGQFETLGADWWLLDKVNIVVSLVAGYFLIKDI